MTFSHPYFNNQPELDLTTVIPALYNPSTAMAFLPHDGDNGEAGAMMMMLGEGGHSSPTVHAPPWTLYEEVPASGMGYILPVSGVSAGGGGGGLDGYADAFAALQRYLPSSHDYEAEEAEADRESDIHVDAYSSDEFRIYEFKVRRCARARSHDWTECPFAHPGEKARRRDPRKFHYSGTACPDFRKGHCKRGDSCEYAHGVFECWLHPARYRTQPCKDGTGCRRRVCFFAHTPDQLRVLSPRSPASGPADSYDGSPLRHSLDAYFKFTSSPTSTLISPPLSPPSDSPPLSPISPSIRRPAPSCMNEVLSSLRQLQLSKVKSVPCSWVGGQLGGFGSPRGVNTLPVFNSLPATPTTSTGSGAWLDMWDRDGAEEPMERVESGRGLRAKMFEKLAKENAVETADTAPDMGWVSELVK